MIHRIEIDPFSGKGTDEAIKYLDKYIKALDKLDSRIEELAMLGVQVATDSFAMASIQSEEENSDVEVTLSKTDNGWVITASGEQVAFMEFGAGVHYNGQEPYLGERPSEIFKIGEYGYGKGNDYFGWTYHNSKGEKVHTLGTPANMGMYYAQKEMAEEAVKIFKELFK